MHQMVYDCLQKHKLLSECPTDFRPLHSTSTTLINITNTLLQNIDNGLLTGLVFLDLSKAFDTLNHKLLLRKLSNYGFNQSSIQWFNSYLSNRAQSVCTNGTVSDLEPILHGFPQGSVLGPLLLIIYVNDLPSVVKYCCVEM